MGSSAKTGSTATGAAAHPLRGMACVDTSGNPRIPILMEMVGALSRATTPQDVLREFSTGITQLEQPRAYVSLSTRDLPPGHYRITRMLSEDDLESANGIPDTNPWKNRDTIDVHSGGFLGAIVRQAYPEIIHNLDVRDDPVVGNALADYGSLMAIPLFDHGEPLNWAIMLRRDREAFTVDELEEQILRANLIGTSIRNVLAADELREAHDLIRREVEQIASIQRALLPRTMPKIPGAEVAAVYHTYDQAGGDYYDFFPLGSERSGSNDLAEPWDGPWGLLIADAAGHGPAAAVLMAMLHTILHAYPQVPEHPSVVLEHANAHLCRKNISSSFVTALFAIYDPKTREFTWARAGHPPALLKDAGEGGTVRRLDEVGSMPLGVTSDATYDDATITLAPGQTLVLYTDGITEAMSPDRTMFEVEGIERALHACSGQPGCIRESVMNALREHEAGVRPSDDQTIVALRVND